MNKDRTAAVTRCRFNCSSSVFYSFTLSINEIIHLSSGAMAASVPAGREAIPRANTCSARTIPVPNTGESAHDKAISYPFPASARVMSHMASYSNGFHLVCFQLIQDEIKALVQLQNRQPHSEFSPTSATPPPPRIPGLLLR